MPNSNFFDDCIYCKSCSQLKPAKNLPSVSVAKPVLKVATDVKNVFLKFWDCVSPGNWIWALTFPHSLKLVPQKWSIDSLMFLSLEVFISAMRLCKDYCCHIWLVLPVSTWICCINYKCGCVGLQTLNTWLIVNL